ncbi:MAG: phosphotransferase family protein [Burkholderiales bacterium]|nr:phosphotransferase family protein [Burkholderiales bacterium]
MEGLVRLSGGASQQTWAFDLVQGAGATEQRHARVLRQAPMGADGTAAAARDAQAAGLAAEAALITLAARHGVPVPAIHHVLTPADGLGAGYVMQRLEGETLGRRIVADAALATAREHLAFQCGQALARIHALPSSAVVPLGLHSGGPAAELARYIQWHAGHGTQRPVFQLALQWLAKRCPCEPAALTLVHGDFRNGNLMVGPGGLVAVLDWELAHRGDPMEDLGWLCVNSWRFGVSALPVGGFGTREQLFAGYAAGGGAVDAARVHWWQVMGTLKWGLICEGMLAAWLAGAERDVEKAAIGRRASETEIDLLDLIVPRS